jgi:hypothetical protein
MKKLLLILFLIPFLANAQTTDPPRVNLSNLPPFNGNFNGTKIVTVVNNLARISSYDSIIKPLVKYTDTAAMFAGYVRVGRFTDSIAALRTYINSQGFLKTETDPKRIVSIAVTGTGTKTITATLADATTVTTTFTDLQGTGGGSFTFTGTSSQYVAGDGSYVTFPTIPTTTSQLTNNSGFITSTALSPYLTSATAASTYATQSALTTTNANVTANTNAIGTLSSLTTTAKSNLVAAINEVNAKPSGGGGSGAPSNVYYLSQNGVPNDADLSLESTTFGTDGTAAIQAILNTATATNPITVYWDTHTSITGIRVKSNTHIIFSNGCGMILRNSSDNWTLAGYNLNQSAIADSNITIEGKGIINGNGWQGGVAKQVSSNATHGVITGLFFAGTKGLTLKDFEIRNARAWASVMFYSENIVIDGVNVNQGTNPQVLQDGLDFISYAKNITVKNCRIRSGDDHMCFAANGVSGNSYGTDETYYTNRDGAQTGVRVDNVYFDGGNWGVRLISSTMKQDDFYFSNIYGYTTSYWLVADNLAGDGLASDAFTVGDGNLGTITFENINVEIGQMAPSGNNAVLACANIGCSADKLIFKNIVRKNFDVSGLPTFRIYHTTTVIRSLEINYHGYDGFNNNAINHIYVSQGTVKQLIVSGEAERALATNASSLVKVASGASVNKLILNGVYATNLSHVVDNSGTVSYISAVNVRHDKADTTNATFLTSSTVSDIVLSNYYGNPATSGTFTAKRGDGFGTTSTSGGGGITETGTAINFATVNNIAETPTGSGIWKVAAATADGYGNTGLADVNLAPSTTGRIYQKLTPAVSSGLFGFSLVNSNYSLLTNTTNTAWSVLRTSDGNLYKVVTGTLTLIGTFGTGTYMGLYRDGSGNIIVQKSDDTVTWTDIATVGTSAAQLYILADIYYCASGPTTCSGVLNTPKIQ